MRIVQLIVLLGMALSVCSMPAAAQPTPPTPFRLLDDLNPGTLDGTGYTHCTFGDGALFGLAVFGSGSLVSNGTPDGSFQLDLPERTCADHAFFQGATYFAGFDETNRSELWRSDGTPAGTQLVADIEPGSANLSPRGFTALNNQLFFFTGYSDSLRLWRYSGAAAPTLITLVSDLRSNVVQIDGARYFIAYGYDTERGSNTYIPRLHLAGDWVFYTVLGSENYAETQLWANDGSAQGARLVFDSLAPSIQTDQLLLGNPGPPPTVITILNAAGRRVIFNVHSGSRAGLWFSDGTPQGNVRLSQAQALSVASSPDGASVFFQTSAGLYRSDGTVSGTSLLVEGNAAIVGLVGAQLFYSLQTTPDGPLSLWRYHTQTGERLRLADYRNPGLPDTAFGERLLFSNCDAQHGCEPWLSDGTAAGTGLLLDINPGPNDGLVVFASFRNQPVFRVVGGRAFFFANNGVYGREPYVTNGTAAGTELLFDTNRQPVGSSPTAMVSVGERLFFLAHKSTGAAYHLFTVEASGTRTDTLMRAADEVFGLNAQLAVAPIAGAVGGRYLWQEFNYGSNFIVRIWTSDGTAAGTDLLATKNAYNLVFANGQAMFSTYDYAAVPRSQLFVTDGTRGGTKLLRESDARFWLQAVGNTFYIIESAEGQHTLWKSDGTAAGTQPVKSIPARADFTFTSIGRTATAGGLLYFTDNNSSLLWRSDGTPEGTFQLTGFPVNIQEVFGGGERLFFSQYISSDGGLQLWSSDGSIAGTRQVNGGGVLDLPIKQGLAAGSRFYFTTGGSWNGSNRLHMVEANAIPVTLLDLPIPDPAYSPEAAFDLLGVFDGELLFSVGELLFSVTNSPQTGLWRSDGTAEGTRKIQPETATEAVTINGGILLSASDAAYGQELWGAATGGGPIVAPALTGAQPGGSALLHVVAYGSPGAALSAESSLTLTVELDPTLTYLGSDGSQPMIEDNQLQFSLVGAGLLGNRGEISLRLGVPADAPLGTRYPVRIKVDGREQLVELMAAHQSYLPLLFR